MKIFFKAFEQYFNDYGLGRVCFYIIIYNVCFFLFALLYFKLLMVELLNPAILALGLLVFYPKILHRKDSFKFLLLVAVSIFFCLYNYLHVAKIDSLVKITKYDLFFAQFDMMVFGMPVANFIGESFFFSSFMGKYLNDLLINIYLLFYLLPFYAVYINYNSLKEKYLIGRCTFSFIFFFSLNYFCYLLVPVMGPQYFQNELLLQPIHFSWLGEALFNFVKSNQVNKLDCFPSGHFGVAILTSWWMYSGKESIHFVIACFITVGMFFATLRLKYHYTLDLIFSPFLVILAFYLAKKCYPEKKTWPEN